MVMAFVRKALAEVIMLFGVLVIPNFVKSARDGVGGDGI